jgi:cell division protein FtsI/penicillin-binding protein 2
VTASRDPAPARSRSPRWSRYVPLLLFAVAVSVCVVVGLSLRQAVETGPGDVLDEFLADWAAGRERDAASRTDRPAAALAALKANRAGLDGARLEASSLEVSERDGRAKARVEMRWDVPGIGPFTYRTRLSLRDHDGWHVAWEPTVVHPRLGSDSRLGTTRSFPERAAILDRDGRPIVAERPVVRVGAVVSDVADPRSTADGLASVLDVDPAPLLRQLRNGGPEQFVEAITLRRPDYEAVEAQLAGVPDVFVVEDTAPLAPTREFARALLGTVAPVTAEQLEKLGTGYAVGDEVGQWGLEARFERRLAGTPIRRVVVRRRNAGLKTLLERPGRPGRPLRTTLDPRVQSAAESAISGARGAAALVALDVASGDILAVANRPVESSFNRAFEGRYPPGSTFKVVSTAALLRDGLDVGETVNCPATLSVQGKLFRNFEGSAAGPVPFSADFAQSCNTAFVSLADRLEPDSLHRAARDFGLGRRLRLPLAAPAASVPPGDDEVEQAAAMIGQHKLLASPLSMAGVAATVAAGRWHAPRLLEGDRATTGPPLPAQELDLLRTLMRAVVTSGTGTALAGVAGEPAGKSGTAEYGSGDPPPTHAWFIAYRDDIAVAVLVERGASGGAVAAPLAAAFFTALDG